MVLAVLAALLVAVPGILAAARVDTPAILGAGVGIAAVATVFAGLSRDALAEMWTKHRALSTTLADGCLTIDGRLPTIAEVTDPVRLGVHRARPSSPRKDRLPAYTLRDIDAELRARLTASGFVLLVGDSTAGKTRTAYEAIAAVLPDDTLIAPQDKSALTTALDAAAHARRCVLWLDDVERFLGADGLTRTRISRILDQPEAHRVIIATIRTSALNLYTDPTDQAAAELYREVRDTLDQAHRLDLARAFTQTERDRARPLAWDERIADALAHAEDFGIPEYLTAARDLLHLWQANADSGEHRRGAALVTAAVDARRAGLTIPLPKALLEQLHERYLAQRGRVVPADILPDAWAWATRVRTTTALLTLGSDPEAVEVFDYLVDHSERTATPATRVPDATFAACLACANPGDATRIAATANQQGRYAIAHAAHAQACAAYTNTLGQDHPDTLRSRGNLAWALRQLGQYHSAEIEYEAILEASIRILGSDHPDTLSARSNLADVLRQLGNREQAEAENRTVLEVRTRILGPDHPDTLVSRSNLAWALRGLRRFREAEAENRMVLEARIRVLGPDHPNTLGSRSNLADVLRELGHITEAEAENRAVLRDYIRVLGPEHPSTLTSRSSLARVLQSLGRHDEAEAENRAVLEARTRLLGPYHPDTRTSRSGLAGALYTLGRYEEAEVEYRAVRDACVLQLGPSHIDTLTSRNNLADVLRKLGRYEEAEDENRAVRDILNPASTLVHRDPEEDFGGGSGSGLATR